jgi:hypothetical protein
MPFKDQPMTDTTSNAPEIQVSDTKNEIAFRHLVRGDYDWMEITVSPGRRGSVEAPHVAMGLTITSSFGAFGFNFPNIHSGPADDIEKVAVDFLCDLTEESLLKRIVEDRSPVFDLEATKAHCEAIIGELRQEYAEHSRANDLEELERNIGDLEELYDEIDGYDPEVQAYCLSTSDEFQAIVGSDVWEELRWTNSRRYKEAQGLYRRLFRPYQISMQRT